MPDVCWTRDGQRQTAEDDWWKWKWGEKRKMSTWQLTYEWMTVISHGGVGRTLYKRVRRVFLITNVIWQICFLFPILCLRNLIDISISEIMCCRCQSCCFSVVWKEALWHEWRCLNAGREKASINTVEVALFICQEMDCSHWEEKLLIWLWCGN